MCEERRRKKAAMCCRNTSEWVSVRSRSIMSHWLSPRSTCLSIAFECRAEWRENALCQEHCPPWLLIQYFQISETSPAPHLYSPTLYSAWTALPSLQRWMYCTAVWAKQCVESFSVVCLLILHKLVMSISCFVILYRLINLSLSDFNHPHPPYGNIVPAPNPHKGWIFNRMTRGISGIRMKSVISPAGPRVKCLWESQPGICSLA